jgi:hypothetical protein
MTWPSADVDTTDMDAGTDSPASARADLKDLADKFNQIRNHVTSFIQTLLDDATAAAARATLGSTAVGDAVFIAANAAAARGSGVLDVPSRGELQTQTFTAFTTGGTSTAFTLTPSPVIGAYAAGQRFRVKFNAANTTTTPTMNINGLGAKNLKVYDAAGAKQNPAVGAFAANMLSDVEYDGTDLVVLIQLPPTLPAAPHVRQAALGGPVNASTGAADFLPATSGTLSLSSTGISSTVPFVVAAANGYGASGAADRIGISTANLTWSSLTASQTCYLYVDVSAAGVLTTGHTTLAPLYPQGGARSITNNQFQFNVGEMYATVGNGAAAVQAWRVYVGECVTSGGGVTSSVSYAYRGQFDSGYTATLPSGSTTVNHNLGLMPAARPALRAQCTTTDGGYAVGDEINVQDSVVLTDSGGATVTVQIDPTLALTSKVVSFRPNTGWVAQNKSTGAIATLTAANWKYRLLVGRGW